MDTGAESSCSRSPFSVLLEEFLMERPVLKAQNSIGRLSETKGERSEVCVPEPCGVEATGFDELRSLPLRSTMETDSGTIMEDP